MASIDRWFSSWTQLHYCQTSLTKNARRIVLLISLSLHLMFIEVFSCVDGNIVETPVKCTSKTETRDVFNEMMFVFVTVLIPTSIMFTFTCLTMRNIRRVRLDSVVVQ